MSKKKFAVIFITLIAIIALSLSVGYYFDKFKSEKNNDIDEDSYTPPTEEEIVGLAEDFDVMQTNILDWSKDIQKLSKKYHLFENLYNSDKKIFIYGYEKREKYPLDINNHKDIQKMLKENHFEDKYEIIAITDMSKNLINVLKVNNIPLEYNEDCGNETQEKKDIDEILDLTIPCYLNSCIIDSKKHQSYIIPKFTPVIKKALKDYK